jgi:hypothetical protein
MPTPPPATISVDYAEAEDSPTGGVDEKGDFEVRTYFVAWPDKQTFIEEMKGKARISGGPGGKWVTVVPYASPDNPRLYISDIKWKPAGTPQVPSVPARHSHAEVVCTFRAPTMDFGPADPLMSITQDQAEMDLLQYCTQEIGTGREVYTGPKTGVKFLSDGRAINSARGVPVTTQTMMLTYHRFPVLPIGYLRDYMDAVNDATFLGCPRGTVMLDVARCTREAVVGGLPSQRMVIAYKYRSVEWNKFLRDDAPTWDFVVANSYTTAGATTGTYGSSFSNATTYPYRNFRKLLWEDFLS